MLQNVRTILLTKKFSVPLDREFGLDFSVLDMPLPKAQAALRVEIIEALRRYEPRAVIKEVGFDGEAVDGSLVSKVRVSVNA